MAGFISRKIVLPVMPKRASDYAVGESVFLPVNGVDTEFLVVHQGNPDIAIYSTTFNDGTILLMKDCPQGNHAWHSSNVNDYENSDINAYLNGDFYALLSAAAQAAAKQVKIPYRPGSGSSKDVADLEAGLSCKVFLLSGAEVGFTSVDTSYLPTWEGAKLDFFLSGTSASADNRRIAVRAGGSNGINWWLRTPYCSGSTADKAVRIDTGGEIANDACTTTRAIRPALVIRADTTFDPETNIIRG